MPRPRTISANYSLTRVWLTVAFLLGIILGVVLAVQTGANAAGPRGVGVLEPAPASTVPAAAPPLTIYAHRGGDPDNTATAFEAAVVAGYNVETDVRLSADGTAYLAHDDYLLAPRCNRSLRISTTTSRELRWVRCDGQPLATLAWLVDRLQQSDAAGLRVLVEGKTGSDRESDVILATIAPLGTRAIVQSFHAAQWRYVEQTSPATVTCALWTYGQAAPLGEPVDMLCPWSGSVTDEVTGDGRPVIVWTVNDAATAASLVGRVAGIITDTPRVIA